jgi:hypothetical protein
MSTCVIGVFLPESTNPMTNSVATAIIHNDESVVEKGIKAKNMPRVNVTITINN